jgi:hypothetical protein
MRAACLLIAVLGCSSIPDLETAAAPEEKPEVQAPTIRQTVSAPDTSDSYGPDYLEEKPAGDRVFAVIDGEEVKASDLFPLFFMDNPLKARDVILNQALNILVRKEAERLGVRADGKKAEAVLESMLEEQQGRIALRINEEMKLEEFVRLQYGMEMTEYRALVRRSAVFHLLLERCVRYHELKVRRLQVGVIIVKEADQAARIRKKLDRGANFEVLAREHSIDPSGSLGGILPPLPAEMDYPIMRDSLQLAKGQVSEVKEANLGNERVYRILKLIDIIEPRSGTYAELEAEVEKNLQEYPLLLPDVIQYWQESLSGRYRIEYNMP